jgi:hypothetical protein
MSRRQTCPRYDQDCTSFGYSAAAVDVSPTSNGFDQLDMARSIGFRLIGGHDRVGSGRHWLAGSDRKRSYRQRIIGFGTEGGCGRDREAIDCGAIGGRDRLGGSKIHAEYASRCPFEGNIFRCKGSRCFIDPGAGALDRNA